MDLRELVGSLGEDHLWVIVFGPGFGESIAVRVPPGAWLVVDSFGRVSGDESRQLTPAARVLDEVGATADCLILTHPHLDHGFGFDRLVRRYGRGKIGCQMIWLEEDELELLEGEPVVEAEIRFAAAEGREEVENRLTAAKAAIAAVRSAWASDDDSRLELWAGVSFELGEGTIDVLYPDEGAVERARGGRVRANTLSSPLLVTWGEARVLLGADLPNPQWKLVQVPGEKPLNDHCVLKVAHHGSKNAQHAIVIGSSPARELTILTPWKRGGYLPSFADGHGLDLLLREIAEVTMTSCPVPLPAPHGPSVRRTDLAQAAVTTIVQGLDLEYEVDADPSESWVAAGIGRDGQLIASYLGSAALTVCP